MKINLNITCPSGEIGFVENKRSFCVEGNIYSDVSLDNDCSLQISLIDSNDNIVRRVISNYKNMDMFLNIDSLTHYEDNLDPNFNKLKEFGFPCLIVDDINNPYDSLYKASNKAWFNDSTFKAIIINASNIEEGAIADDGMNYMDDNNKPYGLLPMGIYKLEVTLKKGNEILSYTSKNIKIGKRTVQLIGRFNPVEHKNNLINWCKENNVSIITDLIPGYLDAYLGKWYYHMGLLKMYRANDLCLFEDVDVKLFNYLIDESSTSYTTELAYLQTKNRINRIQTYYYDIGEAKIDDRRATVKLFKENEFGSICRVDVVKDNTDDNIYYLDDRNVKKHIYDLNNICVEDNSKIAIHGVIKPIQLNPDDFVLKEDNTYATSDYPYIIRYTINDIVLNRQLNMERFVGDESIGKSIYEFYNVFDIKKDCDINIEYLNKKGSHYYIGQLHIRKKLND